MGDVSLNSLDVEKLNVSFGGFTPMPLKGEINATREQMLASEANVCAHREARELEAAIEQDRASEPFWFSPSEELTLRYVVIDGKEVRIERCEKCSEVLHIPSYIDDKPVVAFADDAFSYISNVEEIYCPDTVLSMGGCVFRVCDNLRLVELPRNLSSFASDWLRNCPKLEYLRLPDRLPEMKSNVFDLVNLKHLYIGAGTEKIETGAFTRSKLQSIKVSDDNPFIKTDGSAIYSHDGAVLLAMAVPRDNYDVLDGCVKIAKKGFSTFRRFESIGLPDTLEVLGAFALASTRIESFVAPPGLRRIQEKAFFNCTNLSQVVLNDKLESVGRNAFTGTGIDALRIPASVTQMELPLAYRTSVSYVGKDASFTIAEENAHFRLDGMGGLYWEEEDGWLLLRLLDAQCENYYVDARTTAIADGAFSSHGKLVQVELPEGLEVIGEGAFKACHALKRVNIPCSVISIEKEAFLDTGIEYVYLPRDLEHLGELALVTQGAHSGDANTSLCSVEVDSANSTFYTESGMLLQRKQDGNARVVLCTGCVEEVRIPYEVDEIAAYAFNGITGIRELYVNDRIKNIGIRGLAIACLIEHVHIDLEEPYEGHDCFDLYFPQTDRSSQQMKLALSVPGFVNVGGLFEHYDAAIVNASGFDVRTSRGLEPYDQCRRIVERLRDPVYMTPVNRSMCDHVMKANVMDMCVEAAKHDDREVIDALLDLGYINEDNILAAIERTGTIRDAVMTNYLLEVNRVRFGCQSMNFDL